MFVCSKHNFLMEIYCIFASILCFLFEKTYFLIFASVCDLNWNFKNPSVCCYFMDKNTTVEYYKWTANVCDF